MITLAVNLLFLYLLLDIARAALRSLAVWCWARLRPVRELVSPRRVVPVQSMIE